MHVIRNKTVYFSIAGLILLASVVATILFGLPLGIDFTGGTIVEVRYEDNLPEKSLLDSLVGDVVSGSFTTQRFGEDGYVIRAAFLDEEMQERLVDSLTEEREGAHIERINSIGPTIGAELKGKAVWGLLLVAVLTIFFIAFAFRKVSKPVSSWKYGFVAIGTLLHDIIVPTGVFAILGQFGGAEVDILFVMALLAILGYSVNDTIVVFDRVRENLKINEMQGGKESFDEIVGHSLSQTYIRSLNTSLTTIFVLVALFFLGPSSTHYFALTLLVGVIAGTYSSIFLAAPMLTQIAKWQRKD